MDFNFNLKLKLLCSYDGSLFMKIVENCFRKILENSSFICFNRSKITFDRLSETVTNLFDPINFQLLVDQSNALFSIDREAIEYQLSQADCFV